MDALAAHLNKLGDQQPSQPEAPPRHRNAKHGQSAVNNNNNHSGNTANSHAAGPAAADTVVVDSDSDSEQEDGGRVRNDGTLLASDPPKPL